MKIYDLYVTGSGKVFLQKVREKQDTFEGTRIAVELLGLKNLKQAKALIRAVNILTEEARA